MTFSVVTCVLLCFDVFRRSSRSVKNRQRRSSNSVNEMHITYLDSNTTSIYENTTYPPIEAEEVRVEVAPSPPTHNIMTTFRNGGFSSRNVECFFCKCRVFVWQMMEIYAMEATLPNLTHYQLYRIEVIACHDYLGTETPDEKLCSERAFTSGRTLPKPEADVVNASNVTIRNGTFSNGTRYVFVAWPEPPNPNGLIVSYVVEIMKADVADVRTS